MLQNDTLPRYDLLRTFALAARLGTFAATAEASKLSVSAVSQQVRALEQHLGLSLFERVGRRVRLTPAGAQLSESCQRGFLALDEAVSVFSADFTEPRGVVTIGSPRTFGSYWLRPRLARLLTRWPGLELRVTFDVPSVLEPRVADGSLDLAILARAPEVPSLAATVIAEERFIAVASPRFVKSHGLPVTHADALEHPWAVFDEDLAMHGPWWRAAYGRTAAQPSRFTCHVASLDELLALAEAGIALTVLPDYFVAAALAAHRVVEVPMPKNARHPARNRLTLVSRASSIRSRRFTLVHDELSR